MSNITNFPGVEPVGPTLEELESRFQAARVANERDGSVVNARCLSAAHDLFQAAMARSDEGGDAA